MNKKKSKRAKIHTLHDLPPPYEVMKGAPKAFPPLFPPGQPWADIDTLNACEERLSRLGLDDDERERVIYSMMNGKVAVINRGTCVKKHQLRVERPDAEFHKVLRKIDVIRPWQ